MKKLIPSLLLAALLLAGCNFKDSVIYTGLEAGTIQSSVFTTDDGVKMNVAGNDGKYDVSTSRRVLINYETLPITDPDNLDINVLGLWNAHVIIPVSASQVPQDAVDMPIKITDAWFNAGYLNLLATVAGKDEDGHILTAAYTVSLEGITLRLYHDGTTDNSDNTRSIFISIPMDDIAVSYEQTFLSVGKEAVYPADILFQWTWYVLEESGPVMLYEKKGTFTPARNN